jgi:hypothetical protein
LSLLFLPMNGVPFAFNVSALSFETLPSYNDLNFPSSKTATGIPFVLNFHLRVHSVFVKTDNSRCADLS